MATDASTLLPEQALPNTSALWPEALLPRNNRALLISLMRARETIMVRFRPVLIARDITEQQWRVIRVLGEESTLDASELANRASILAPSLTRIIKVLEDRGYVTRSRDRTDGRRAMLAITEEGLGLIRDIAPEAGEMYREILLKFGPERMEQLTDLLNEFAALKVDPE